MGKIKLEMKFFDLDNKIIPLQNGKEMTARDALKVVCTAELPTDNQGAVQDVLTNKMLNFDIYLKIREAPLDKEVEFTAEEVVQLKKRAPFILNTLVLGPIVRALDGK